MNDERTVEWYRFTCMRCSTWWITHYEVRSFTDDAGVSRVFYSHGGMPCEAPAHADTVCPACHHSAVRAERLNHPAADTVPQRRGPGMPGEPRLLGAPGRRRHAARLEHVKFRAVVHLDEPAPPQAGQYPSGTRALMVRASSAGRPRLRRYFPAAIFTGGGQPLTPGDGPVVVTIVVTGDGASEFFWPGQAFGLWDGADVGRGTVSRKMFDWPEFA